MECKGMGSRDNSAWVEQCSLVETVSACDKEALRFINLASLCPWGGTHQVSHSPALGPGSPEILAYSVKCFETGMKNALKNQCHYITAWLFLPAEGCQTFPSHPCSKSLYPQDLVHKCSVCVGKVGHSCPPQSNHLAALLSH